LSGFIFELDSYKPISEAKIHCQVEQLIYDWQLENPIVETDSTGYYEFRLSPGNYTLYFYRDGFPVDEKKVTLYYQSRTFNNYLPKIWWTAERYYFPGARGLDWKDANQLAVAGTISIDSTTNWYRVYYGNFSSGFNMLSETSLSPENQEFHSMIWAESAYWATGGSYANPKIFNIHASLGKVTAEIIAPHRLMDLAYDSVNLWATAGNDSIYQFVGISNHIQKVLYSPANYAGGFTYNGESWYLAAGSRKLLYHLDGSSFLPFETFRLFFKDKYENIEILEDIPYMAVDNNKNLWCINGDWVYHFSY